jgi:hypothetical protein
MTIERTTSFGTASWQPGFIDQHQPDCESLPRTSGGYRIFTKGGSVHTRFDISHGRAQPSGGWLRHRRTATSACESVAPWWPGCRHRPLRKVCLRGEGQDGRRRM